MALTEIPIELSSTPGIVDNSNATAITIDASENVGIGTSTPVAILTTENSGPLTLDSNDGDHSGFGLLIEPSTITVNTVNSAIGFASTSGRKYAAIGMQTYADADQNGLNFYVQSTASGSSATLTEAMRIDASGNLLVGKTAFSTNTAGFEARSSGFIGVTRADVGAYFTRLTTDGEIIQFRKDTTPVGSIGSVSGVSTYIHGGSGYSGVTFGNDEILPCSEAGATRDDAIDLGDSSGRFKDLWLSGKIAKGTGGELDLRSDGGGFAYRQNLDVATAGCTFTGQSTRGDMAAIRLYQTATGADGGYIRFDTSNSGSTTPSEKARITQEGNLLVGTTTAAPNSTTTIKGTLGLVGPSSTSTSSIFFNNPSNVKYWGIATDETTFYITDADFTHYCYVGQSMTAWTFASDRRLKENIVDVPYGLDTVMAMQPRAFKFKSSGVETIGFVAQELQEVVPEAVTGTEVEYSDDDTSQEKANKSLGVSQDTLIPVLVKAIQEQQATIEALTARIAALES